MNCVTWGLDVQCSVDDLVECMNVHLVQFEPSSTPCCLAQVNFVHEVLEQLNLKRKKIVHSFGPHTLFGNSVLWLTKLKVMPYDLNRHPASKNMSTLVMSAC